MKNRFAFPLLVALGALLFYALTLSRGVTAGSLPLAMKVAGWDWLPMNSRPVAWLLTLPLRLLPAGMIPTALNFFSAATAAAVLGILVRSVELLTWDCPPDAKKIWALRLPALFAVTMCGLEFNFWQEATAMTGEMLELLLFAAAIWCLLEFRGGKNPRWLDAAAVVWGVGLAENWAMQLTLPVFAVTLLGWRGGNFFEWRFWRRMALLGLAGFSVFALLPLTNAMALHSPWSISECWLIPWRQTRDIFHNLYFGLWSWRRLLTLTLVFYFIVPVLVCVVRIPSEASPNFYGADRLRIAVFRALRGALLLVCVWLAFDPEAGPRKIIFNQLKVSWPLLSFDYLLALGAAFLLGSLVYAAQVVPDERPATRWERLLGFIRRHALIPLTLFAALLVVKLGARSWTGISQAHAAALAVGGEIFARSLPAEGGIVLAHDPVLLMSVQAALARRGDADRWQAVDLQQLPSGKYRAALDRKSPAGWTAGGAQNLTANATLQLLSQLKTKRRIFYLQPVPGNFLWEQFYPEPSGAVSELKFLPRNNFSPPLTPVQIAENQKFWDAAWEKNLERISSFSSVRPGKSLSVRWTSLPVEPVAAQQAGRWFASALDNWGVALQRSGKLLEAQRRFEQAQQLNPDNVAAKINLQCNASLRTGRAVDLSAAPALTRSAVSLPQLTRLMNGAGAFDEAVMCSLVGEACANSGWPRQAVQQLNRSRTLAPDFVRPGLALAKIYSRYGVAAKVFELVKDLRRFETNTPAGRALGVDLAVLEAKAWIGQTNVPEANRALETVLQKNADSSSAWETVFQAYLAFGSPTNALALLDRMLAKNPDNLPALNNKAAVLLQTQRPAEALPVLDRALALTNMPGIRLNRAIALLESRKFAAAEQEFKRLQSMTADKYSVAFGLARLAELRQDPAAAMKQYSICLANVPAGSTKWREAKTRLDGLAKTAASVQK